MNFKVKHDVYFMQDIRLSLEAKGLLAYFLFNPEQTYATVQEWHEDHSKMSIKNLQKIIMELELYDYISFYPEASKESQTVFITSH